MFVEEHDPDEDGERSFDVQQQGTSDAGDALESEKQEHRREDSARDDHCRHAWSVGAT